MKKILTFLLVAVMLVSALVVTSPAASANEKITVNFANTKPKFDAKISKNEYGKAIVTYKVGDNNDSVITDTNTYEDWGFEFYAAWDFDYLYLAWQVNSKVHGVIPDEVVKNDASGINNMWEYSCVQWMITPGEPNKDNKVYQTADWSGNYMECGVTIRENGDTDKCMWSIFNGGNILGSDEWDAVANRDDSANTTTYEVRIPWERSGITTVGNDEKFGLIFAVASQEHYVKDVSMGMLEWQDGILNGKNADAAGIIVLAGDKTGEKKDVDTETLKEGTLPKNHSKKSVDLTLDSVNTPITAEQSTLITNPAEHTKYNTKYTALLLLAPIANETNTYYLVESKAGNGEEIVFDTPIEAGMIAASFHSDISEGAAGAARKTAAMSIEPGTKLHLFGVNLAGAKLTFSNAMLYTVDGEEKVELGNNNNGGDESSGDDNSGDVSDVTSDDTSAASSEVVDETSVVADDSSEVTDAESAEASAEESKDDEGGIGVGGIIGIVVAVLAVIGCAVFFILKKKKK